MHYTTSDFLDGQTFAQFYVIWCKAPKVNIGSDMDSIRTKINKRRAELGMPPMKPEPKPEKKKRNGSNT